MCDRERKEAGQEQKNNNDPEHWRGQEMACTEPPPVHHVQLSPNQKDYPRTLLCHLHPSLFHPLFPPYFFFLNVFLVYTPPHQPTSHAKERSGGGRGGGSEGMYSALRIRRVWLMPPHFFLFTFF